MPVYNYKSVNKRGRVDSGVITAQNERDVERKLSQQGQWLVDAELTRSPIADLRVKAAGFGWNLGEKLRVRPQVSRQDLIEFCVQLSTQTRAGVPILAALGATAEETENDHLRSVLRDIRARVESGAMLHAAMEHHLSVFSRQMISVIRAGEISSHLPEALAEIRRDLEWVERMVGDIRQATIYPMFVLIAIGIVGILIFSFVVPRFATLLGQLKIDLPGLTKFIFGISDFMAKTWWAWLALLVICPIAVKLVAKSWQGFGVYLDRTKLKLPILGPLYRMIAMSRFAHTLASLYRAGIRIVEALQYCEQVAGNRAVEQAIRRVRIDVSEGELVSQALSKEPAFTQLVVRMVATGERSGQLDETLESVADYYNEFVPRRVRRLFSYAEPIMIIAIIVIVGIVALAVLLPIVTLLQGLK